MLTSNQLFTGSRSVFQERQKKKDNSICIFSFNKICISFNEALSTLLYSELSAAESAAVPAHLTKRWGVTNSDEWHPDLGIETGKTCCSKGNWAIPHHVSDQYTDTGNKRKSNDGRIETTDGSGFGPVTNSNWVERKSLRKKVGHWKDLIFRYRVDECQSDKIKIPAGHSRIDRGRETDNCKDQTVRIFLWDLQGGHLFLKSQPDQLKVLIKIIWNVSTLTPRFSNADQFCYEKLKNNFGCQ